MGVSERRRTDLNENNFETPDRSMVLSSRGLLCLIVNKYKLMLINVLKLPMKLHINRGDTPMFNKFGNRISTGYDRIDGEYVVIPVSKIDNANIYCIENNDLESRGMLVLKSKDRIIKKMILYITGDKTGYVYVHYKYLYGLLG